ncbi:MAG: hypothetical protein WA151_04845 [Desulfatirhabdiaceae bacterium]
MAKKNEESKELVSTVGVGVVEEMPDWMKDMGDDNRGNEGITKEDLVIPRLSIIQAISPELDEKDPAYIEGAKNGMLFNTLTKKLYTEVLVIPVAYEKKYLLWRDRKKGGGFGGQYDTEQEANAAIMDMEDPDEWEATDTPTHLCLVVSDGKPFEIAIPMPKSKAKVSRQFNSTIRLLGGPRFSRVYKISVVDDKKKSTGDKFKNFNVIPAGFPNQELFQLAEKLYTDLSAGAVNYKVDDDYRAGDDDETAPHTDKF